MTEKSTIPRLFPDTFSIGQVELTGQYTGPIVRGRLFINDQHVSWGGTFNNGFFTYYVGLDRIKRHDKVELVGYDSGNNEIARAVVTIKIETDNALFKKNESLIRIQSERVDPISTKVVFFSHDRGTAKLLFKLEKDGAPQPLSNGTVVPICLEGGSETSDMGRFRHVYHAVIEDAAEGLVSIILKNNILGHQGRVDGSIYIKPPNDQQLDTAGRFLFHIERSPIDDMTGGADQFYYDGFHEISEKIAEVRRIVSDMTTEAQAEVNKKIADLEAQINRFLQDAQSKFTSLDSDIAAVRQTVTQLENRLTAVRNEIEALFNTMKIDTRNWVTGTTEPLNIVGTNVTNQTVNPYRFTFGQIKDIPAKVGDSVAIAYDWEASGSTISGTFFPQFNNQPYSVANRETISPSATNQSGTSSFVTTVQAAWLAENAISNAIGFRADNLQGTVTITNFRFLIANKDSGWLPASEEYLPELNKNLAGSNYYTKLPFDVGKNVYGEESNVITGVIIPVKRGQLYTVTSYNRNRHDRFNLVFSTSANRPTAGTALTYIMGNNGNEPMTWRATSDGWMGVQLATGSSDGFPMDGRIMIERRRQSSGTWKPAFDDIALKVGTASRAEFEETQQKVQTLEQNTIRITNQFPDPKFQNRTPQPVAENGIEVSYDSDGIMFNHFGQTQGRAYWGSPPLGLEVGKSYNVSMRMNTGTVSIGKEFIVGTSGGENFSFTPADSGAHWVEGTIKLTNWSAFSIWMPPISYLRIRELYIYEANTNITTAEIERLKKDNSLPAISPTFDRRFISYSADNGIWHCQVERTGNIVALSGAIANTEAIGTTGTEKILMARLPVGYRPKKTVNRVMAGSGTAIFNMEIDPTGEVWMARYRGATTSFTYAAVQFVGAWLNVGTTFLGEDI